MKKSLVQTTVAVGVAAALAGISHNASAAGFALIENSAHQMGLSFAGQTAAATDLSTIWSNPAGMTRYEGRHFTAAIHAVDFSAEFSGTGTAFTEGPSPPFPPPFPIQPADAQGGEAGTTAPVANLYWLQQVNDGSTRLGIAVNFPFGLKTDYEDDWVGRYHATDSEVMAVNINPSLAWKFGQKFSFGVGASIQYFKAELSQNLDSFNICFNFFDSQGDPTPDATCAANGLPSPANAATDSDSTVDADSWGMGLNVGFMFEPTERTRIGLQYRSPIRQELEGDAKFTLNPSINFFPINAQLGNQDVKATVDLPANASIGVYHEFSNRIAIMADAMWTQWSSLEDVKIKYPDPSSSLFQLPDTVLTLDWEDAWRYALGLGVPAGQKVMLRFGLAYDETPVPSAERQSPRVPDGDRTWYSLGLGWQIGKRSSIDFGLAYLDVDKPEINNTINTVPGDSANSTAPGYNLNGEYDASVWIGSFQYNVAFSAF
jgi:long-chain fatty acid transport protein